MKKLIIKTALITISVLIIASLTVFSLWLVGSPQTMATSCEKTGNYSFAVTCAGLRYKYTKDVYDLARCVDNAILSGKDNLICEHGEKLLSDGKFDEVCTAKDGAIPENTAGVPFGYKAYVCGHIAVAEYRLGDIDKAVKTALTGGENSFPKLVIEVSSNGDRTSANAVLSALETLEQTEETKALSQILKNI